MIFTFVDEPLDVHEHVRERRDLLAVLEQLRQVVGDALRVDRVHFCHFHRETVRRRRRRVCDGRVDGHWCA